MFGQKAALFCVIIVGILIANGLSMPAYQQRKDTCEIPADACGADPASAPARSGTGIENITLPSESDFKDPPKEYRVMPIFTTPATNATLDYLDSLGVGGLVVNPWNWNGSLLDHANDLNFTLWANDYYMYPSGNANPYGGVQERLWNPSFEISTIGMWADGWQWSYYDLPVYDQTGTQSHSGTDAIACDDMNYFMWPQGVQGGSRYNFSVWAKGPPGTAFGRIILFWVNATDALSVNFTVFPVTTSYTYASFEATAPSEAHSARILLQGIASKKYVWFDDIQVRDVTAPMTNELVNPGFEADALPYIGVPDGWVNLSVTPPAYDTSGTQSHSGTDAVQVNSTRQLAQAVTATPGRNYYLGEWIKGAAGGEIFQMVLVFFDPAFTALSAAWYFVLASTSYRYYDLAAAAPAGTAYAVPILTTAQNADFVWVDDVMLNETAPLNPGVSRGPVLDGHPELESQGLYYNSQDVTSPATSDLQIPFGHLVSAVAAPVTADGSLDLGSKVDVSGSKVGDHIQWTPSSGKWRVMVFVTDILMNGTEVDRAVCNMHQINVMNPTAVQSFIDEMYRDVIYQGTQPYFGNMVKASFTDEVSNLAAFFLQGQQYPVVAWLDDEVNGHHFGTEFSALHGYDLISVLPALFNDAGPMTGKYRMDFYNTSGVLQGKGYYKMIGEWCKSRGFDFSGHLLGEDSLLQHVAFYGNFFESIKHMGIPGIDALIHIAGDIDSEIITPKMASSATTLYGKEHTMTEYSVASTSMNYRNMTAVVNWQAVQGIDRITSFSFYAGFLPDNVLKNHSAQVGRTCYMLDQGEFDSEIAVLYPISSIQAEFMPRADVIWNKGVFPAHEHDDSFINLTKALLRNQMDFIYINDENLDRALIDNSTGEAVLRHQTSGCAFRVLVVPEIDAIKNSTLQKIKAFYDAGGIVLSVGDLPFQTEEHGEDAYVTGLVTGIWDNKTVGPSGYSERASAGGGLALWADGDPLKAVDALRDHIDPDLYISGATDDHIYYRKQMDEGFYNYFIVNNRGADSQHTYGIKGMGAPSYWNPETGAVTQALPAEYSYSVATGYTTFTDLKIPAFSSVFIVIKRPVLSLEPGDVAVTPGVPLLGYIATISVNITNIGYANAASVELRAYLGPTVSGATQIDPTKAISLASGENRTVTFSWNTAGLPGTNEIIIRATLPPSGSKQVSKMVYVNTPPTAAIWCDKGIVLTKEEFNLSSNMSSDADGPLAIIHWDLGDGNASSAASAHHSYADDGVYMVLLTVTDSHGVPRNISNSITVNNRGPKIGYTKAPLQGNFTTVFVLDASASTDPDGTIANVTWKTGDDRSYYGKTASWSYPKSGAYNATLTLKDDDGATAATYFILTVTNLRPKADIDITPDTGNITTKFTFTPLTSDMDGEVVAYFWDFEDGTNSSQSKPSHIFADDGYYVVSLTVQDDQGAWSYVVYKGVRVANLPPIAKAACSSQNVYVNLPVNLTANGTSDPDDLVSELHFSWDLGDGTEDEGIYASHAYSVAGRYNITLTVTDDDGANATLHIAITVSDHVNQSDTDADGLPDAWEMLYFGDLDQGPDGDYDWDGHTNMDEYLDGTDPADLEEEPPIGPYEPHLPLAMKIIAAIAILVIIIVIVAGVLLFLRSKKEVNAGKGGTSGMEGKKEGIGPTPTATSPAIPVPETGAKGAGAVQPRSSERPLALSAPPDTAAPPKGAEPPDEAQKGLGSPEYITPEASEPKELEELPEGPEALPPADGTDEELEDISFDEEM